MPRGTSKGTNVPRNAGCPPKYIKLKQWIQQGLDDRSLTKRLLYWQLKDTYPRLFERLRVGNTFRVEALYSTVGLPTAWQCLTCDSTIRLKRNAVRPTDYCRLSCSSKDRALISIKLESSRKTRTSNALKREAPVEDRSDEFPGLRKSLLDAWNNKETRPVDLGTQALKKVLKNKYPSLYEYVKLGQGVDRRRLLLSLGLPLNGVCVLCGNKTKLPKRGLRFTKTCGASCGAKLANPTKREAYFEKTGYYHSNHNPEVQEKMLRASGLRRTSSEEKIIGRNDVFQSKHELVALAQLQQDPSVVSIRTGGKVPSLLYYLDGKQHSYLPDFGVQAVDYRCIVEVKSDWTLFLKSDLFWKKNYLKYRAAHREFKGAFRLAIPHRSHWYMVKDPAAVMRESSVARIASVDFMDFLVNHANSKVWFTKSKSYGAC